MRPSADTSGWSTARSGLRSMPPSAAGRPLYERSVRCRQQRPSSAVTGVGAMRVEIARLDLFGDDAQRAAALERGGRRLRRGGVAAEGGPHGRAVARGEPERVSSDDQRLAWRAVRGHQRERARGALGRPRRRRRPPRGRQGRPGTSTVRVDGLAVGVDEGDRIVGRVAQPYPGPGDRKRGGRTPDPDATHHLARVGVDADQRLRGTIRNPDRTMPHCHGARLAADLDPRGHRVVGGIDADELTGDGGRHPHAGRVGGDPGGPAGDGDAGHDGAGGGVDSASTWSAKPLATHTAPLPTARPLGTSAVPWCARRRCPGRCGSRCGRRRWRPRGRRRRPRPPSARTPVAKPARPLAAAEGRDRVRRRERHGRGCGLGGCGRRARGCRGLRPGRRLLGGRRLRPRGVRRRAVGACLGRRHGSAAGRRWPAARGRRPQPPRPRSVRGAAPAARRSAPLRAGRSGHGRRRRSSARAPQLA